MLPGTEKDFDSLFLSYGLDGRGLHVMTKRRRFADFIGISFDRY